MMNNPKFPVNHEVFMKNPFNIKKNIMNSLNHTKLQKYYSITKYKLTPQKIVIFYNIQLGKSHLLQSYHH